ncbi:DUF2303 family protein [Propionimicrobium sp. PCR01-08-3]|uniref:DUF2303 family protein n=1 Tax=Propionimicrobium sp. PCR01-08-3 TaxID=3052086 RepID=UPI00255C55BE|nr:DUF2303 family protein [Propionimicrobium sp. PCR01-08-3]WIY84310.1 DUF2303 family protein [Propionimicrobium sp. PCR01-08-3]
MSYRNPETIEFEDNAYAMPNPTPTLIASLAQQAANPRLLEEGVYSVLDADGAVQIVETSGYQHDRKESESPAPRRIKRTMIVRDVESLLDAIASSTNTEKTEQSIGEGRGWLEVWADIDRRTVTAITDGVDGWREHRIRLELRHSAEWEDWVDIDGKLLDQVPFSEFVEDHMSSIAHPDGAQLLDICQTLQAHTGVAFKQQSILANGQRAFQWEETVEAKAGQKGDLSIPNELTLALRPFQGSEPVAITARFRFRPASDGLRLGVRLVETPRIVEEAFDDMVAEVSASIPVAVRFGRPEA